MMITAQQIEAMQAGETLNLPDTDVCVNRTIVRGTLKNGGPVWHHSYSANLKALRGRSGGFSSRSVAAAVKALNLHQGK